MKIYYTKCGRQFKKNSTATVTGYHVDLKEDGAIPEMYAQRILKGYDELTECVKCPFKIKVTEGWQNPIFKRWECRAGSEPPNQKNDWRGSLEDKNTIKILSLHNDFLESVIEYCKKQTDLSAGYNQDEDDCRRVISVSCSSNKKGIAAKKKLIEKFFPVAVEPEETQGKKCGTCYNYNPDDECPGTGRCPERMTVRAEVQAACQKHKYKICASCENEGTGCAPNNPESGLCVAYVEKPEPKRYVDTKTGRLIFVRSGIGGDTFKAVYQDAGKWGGPSAHGVKSPELPWRESPEEAQADLDAYAKKKGWKEYIEERKEANELHLDSSKKCEFKDEQCPYYCSHNEGCSLKISKGEAVKMMITEMKPYNCDVYHKAKQKHFIEEPETKLIETVGGYSEEPATVTAFDYSTVDDDTAAFLQEKEQKITQIRMMSVMAIGKELKEVHDKLANNRTGTFGKWCESIGMSRRSAENYIKEFDYIEQNFRNIEDAENIQKSLLFAISKPSAPNELQDKVLSGDITSHKQYKELEDKLKAEKERADSAELREKAREKEKVWEEKKAMDNYKAAQEALKRAEQAEKALQQLTKAHTVSPGEIQKLKDELAEAQRQVQILTDELMKPVEIEPAVVEKVPEEIERELAELRKQTSIHNDYAFVSDILNCLRIAHHDKLKNWAKETVLQNATPKLKAIREELIDFGVLIESMIDYLDDEIQKK